MQVRVLDYGMEDCYVSISLAPPRYLDNILENPSSPVLKIWLLDSKRRVDLRQMTQRSRPGRIQELGSFDISKGVNSTTTNFNCESGAPYYVELECYGDGCELDFWQQRVSDMPSKLNVPSIRPSSF